jgi:hypothetical protein
MKTKTKTYTGKKHPALKPRDEHHISDIEPHIFRPNCRVGTASNVSSDVDQRIRDLLGNNWTVEEVAVQEFRGERETLKNYYKEGYGMVTEKIENPRYRHFREHIEKIAAEMN